MLNVEWIGGCSVWVDDEAIGDGGFAAGEGAGFIENNCVKGMGTF